MYSLLDQTRHERPAAHLDFSVLNDPEFKEDSVREEIVAPLVRALGYSPSGRFRVTRSRPLEHPFVSIGSLKKRINIFPDYLLSVDDRLCWVLDAKAPNEPVDHPDHVSQAYSYAIHRDVRVDWFALCNGHELAVYNVADMSSEPRLRVQLARLSGSWQEVQDLLRPMGAVATLDDYAKDLGITLMRLGTPETMDHVFIGVPVIHVARVADDLFTLGARTTTEGFAYQISFDFEKPLLEELGGLLPNGARIVELLTTTRPLVTVNIEAQIPPMVTIAARRGTQILENDREHYIPLRVTWFKPFLAQVSSK